MGDVAGNWTAEQERARVVEFLRERVAQYQLSSMDLPDGNLRKTLETTGAAIEAYANTIEQGGHIDTMSGG